MQALFWLAWGFQQATISTRICSGQLGTQAEELLVPLPSPPRRPYPGRGYFEMVWPITEVKSQRQATTKSMSMRPLVLVPAINCRDIPNFGQNARNGHSERHRVHDSYADSTILREFISILSRAE